MGPSILRFAFEGTAWTYSNPGKVYFVSLPKDISEDILDLVGLSLNPWGTVPVRATIEDYSWTSSMFPRKDRQCYDLPLNARTRKRLGIGDGDPISVTIEVELPA